MSSGMRIEYSGAVIGEAEIEAVNRVLRKGSQPAECVGEFESRCAALLGKRHGVMVNSGSSALMIALRLLGAPPGSEILTSVLTFGDSTAVTTADGGQSERDQEEPDHHVVGHGLSS